MRATTMTPEEIRAAGIYLNAGRRRGWRKRLALLLDTPEATIAAWATRSAGNARPIPGVAAVGVRLLAALLRDEVAATGDMAGAARRLGERVAALARARDAVARPAAAPPQPPQPPADAPVPIRFEPAVEKLPMAAVPAPGLGTPDLRPVRRAASRRRAAAGGASTPPVAPAVAPAEHGVTAFEILPAAQIGKAENRPRR